MNNIMIPATVLKIEFQTPLVELVEMLEGTGWRMDLDLQNLRGDDAPNVVLTDGEEEIELHTGEYLVRVGDEFDAYDEEAYQSLGVRAAVG